LVTTEFLYDSAVASSAAGTIAINYDDYPTVSPDWASAIAVYAEYRILAMEVKFIPNVAGGNVSTLTYAPLYMVWNPNQATGVLTSYAAASQLAAFKSGALNQPLAMSHKMSSIEEGTFVSTLATTVDYSFQIFSTGLTASQPYGRVIVRWLTQFRGRQ